MSFRSHLTIPYMRPHFHGILVIVVAMAVVAGCTAPAGLLDITEREIEQSDSGNLLLTTSVKNTDGSDRLEGTLLCNVTVGNQSVEQSKQLSLRGGQSRSHEFEYDIPFSEYEDDGTFQCTIQNMVRVND